MIAPLLDEIARENEGKFRVAKVNIDDDPALMQRYSVRAVPTLLFFSGGELKDQLVGGAPEPGDPGKTQPPQRQPGFGLTINPAKLK